MSTFESLSKQAKPFPLGSTLDELGCNFAVHAPNITDIELVLFSEEDDYVCFPFKQRHINTHYLYIKGIKAGQRYAFKLKTDTAESIVVTDPYAKALDKVPSYVPPYSAEKSWDMSKSVVIDPQFDWQKTTYPRIPINQTILFETHVKGLTKLNPRVDEELRGTYLGLIHPTMLEFYKEQGITTLQLLPITASIPEEHLLSMGMTNYWGYNPINFMAPDPRFAIKDAVVELKTAVKTLHEHGIEVIMDVVYNHTAEGGHGGPVLNMKALDDDFYLKHNGDYCNYTGCGNSVNLTYQPALDLVMDTLRYWVEEFQIDGFRFDLAATLGRDGHLFDRKASFFQAVNQDPILRHSKLIAEPWDIGPNGYQVGNFPGKWHECNDKLRDTMRSFWRGDSYCLKDFATRLMGSRDIYSAFYWPQKLTVNYITYHDGFTLQDLVSYQDKHNEANGENNRDGHGDNRSANYGIEGPSNDPNVIAVREKQKRNLTISLLFSFGIPHILMADVLSHSQQGNNNAYCQDNELSWLNWESEPNKDEHMRWLAHAVHIRQNIMPKFIEAFSRYKRHSNRIKWLDTSGETMIQESWNCEMPIALHIGIGIHDTGEELLYLVNQTDNAANFQLPDNSEGKWLLICDTSVLSTEYSTHKHQLPVAPKSMVLLVKPVD